MGRNLKYDNEQDRNDAIRRSKTKYMLGKQWVCPVCDNHDYSLAGKWMHIKSKKHITNTIIKALEDDNEINLITIDES